MARIVGWLPVLAGLAACAPDMDAPEPWIPVGEIAGVLAPELGDTPSPRTAGASLELITFNVQFGTALPRLVDSLIMAGHDDADVLFVQEIESYPDEPGSRTRQLADALGMGYVYAPARQEGRGTHGIGILSHHVLSGARVMRLPAPGAYPNPFPRAAVAAEIDTLDGPLTLICVHLDTRLSAAERVLQLRPAVLDAPDHTIVGGDMNTLPFAWFEAAIPDVPAHIAADTDQGPVLDDYLRALDYATPTAGVGGTQHVAGLSFRLDAIYTRGVTPGAARVDRGVEGSDHWPLILDVTLAGARAPGRRRIRRD